MPAIVFENTTRPILLDQFCEGVECLARATKNAASTSKSGLNVVCLPHFDFEMCFAP